MDIIACSLNEVVDRNLAILADSEPDEDSIEDFVKSAEFALRGVYENQQYSISVAENGFTLAENHPTILRDYDSLLGFCPTIPLLQDIYLYPVFNPMLTLLENVHLKVHFRTNVNEVRLLLLRKKQYKLKVV
jgi:hypothetical protein